MDHESTRKRFEEIIFADYFIRGINFNGGGQFAEVKHKLHKDELCEREGESYKREEVSAMWHGWKLAMKVKGEGRNGWVVENGQSGSDLRYRSMKFGQVFWTDKIKEALRFFRREDAEMFSEEDEDAWRIVEVKE
ncbi:MAG: hypothetical protein WC302_00845 [Candidatus Paceibacterota bacterium]|jgi:hypothetical protein